MTKVLVTGAAGFLGSRAVSFLKEQYEVLACGHGDLDITSATQVEEFFAVHQPQVVVHCAAISDTGFSQQHPEISLQVNVQGTVNLARACAAHGAKLIYMSSDQVYNDTDMLGGLSEEAPLCPNSVYGQHKLEAERQVAAILPSAVGLRLTWMYDRLDSAFKLNRNILLNLQQAAEEGRTLSIATREFRGITWVWQVVHALPKVMTLPGGVYNYGSENTLNSYETFVAVAHLMKLPTPETWILKDEERFPAHPRNLSMDTSKLRRMGISFPDSVKGVEDCLKVD